MASSFSMRSNSVGGVLTVISLFAVKVAAFLNTTEDAKQLVSFHVCSKLQRSLQVDTSQ